MSTSNESTQKMLKLLLTTMAALSGVSSAKADQDLICGNGQCVTAEGRWQDRDFVVTDPRFIEEQHRQVCDDISKGLERGGNKIIDRVPVSKSHGEISGGQSS